MKINKKHRHELKRKAHREELKRKNPPLSAYQQFLRGKWERTLAKKLSEHFNVPEEEVKADLGKFLKQYAESHKNDRSE